MTYTLANPKVKLILTDKEKLMNSPTWYAYVQSIPCYLVAGENGLTGIMSARVGSSKRTAAQAEAA